MSKTMIEVKDLTCDYGHGRGVFHLSFAIEQGEVFGFLGPNGAGKTTTIRQLMGFVRPDSFARTGKKAVGTSCSHQHHLKDGISKHRCTVLWNISDLFCKLPCT